MDDSNPNAENAIDGAISYAVKNNIGKVTTKEIVRVADEEAYKTIEQGDFIFFLFVLIWLIWFWFNKYVAHLIRW